MASLGFESSCARSELLGGLAPELSDVRVLDYERMQLGRRGRCGGPQAVSAPFEMLENA